MPEVLKVFISYSHDSEAHEDRVLDLANRLREDGIDAEIDQYQDSPPDGWPAWCEKQIKAANFVLLVCTKTYLRRVDGEEELGIGHGVLWEARIIRQILYDSGSISNKFIPLLFSQDGPDCIPTPVKGAARFTVDQPDGYKSLYRLLTKQPKVLKPALGQRKAMLPKERKSAFAASASELALTGEQPGPGDATMVDHGTPPAAAADAAIPAKVHPEPISRRRADAGNNTPVPDLAAYSKQALDWLVRIQDEGAGGWGQFENSDPNSLNTAEVLLALLDSKSRRLDIINKGLDFLVQQQLVNDDPFFDGHGGAWGRRPKGKVHADFRVPDTVRTAYALMALCEGGRTDDIPAIQAGVHRLSVCRGGEDGWPYRPSPAFARHIFPTCLAMSALSAARPHADDDGSEIRRGIDSGVRFLQSQFEDEGHCGKDATCLVPHTIYAVRALISAAAEGCELVDDACIASARRWLRKQGSKVTRLSHEAVVLAANKEERSFNYCISHYTPALFLSTFGRELPRGDRLAERCISAIIANRDPFERGFAVRRSASWATGKCVSAMLALEKPSGELTPAERKAGPKT